MVYLTKVSVIVPIYNAGRGNKLNKCIESILNQTFHEIELILVNDGSTDNSLEVCRYYQKEDQRVIIIDKKNEGCVATRRRGLEVSSSDYIMFVDADDWIDCKTVEILYNECIENHADITVCNTYKVLGKGMIIKRKNESLYFREDRLYNKKEIMRDLVTAYFFGHPFPPSLFAKLYRRDLLINSGKYLDRIYFLGEDLFYNLEIFTKINIVKVINKPLYYYRVGGYSSKYMPFLFSDMVNGYRIQKEVIDEYFSDSRIEQYNGISIMLLNTFKTCLYNLFNGELNDNKIKDVIKDYVSNDSLKECLNSEGSNKYFSSDYLNAIRYKNIDYLFDLGKKMYKKRKTKTVIMNVMSKLSII